MTMIELLHWAMAINIDKYFSSLTQESNEWNYD